MPVSESRATKSKLGATAPSGRSDHQVVLTKAQLQLKEFKLKQIRDGEILLTEKLPERMAFLDDLLKRPEFNVDLNECRSELNIHRPDPDSLKAEPDGPLPKKRKLEEAPEAPVNGTQVYHFADGKVDLNKTIVNLFNYVKPVITQHMEDCDALKMWIEFLIPKVEDGNNFGVDIQEECRKEVSTAEAEAALYLEQASRYHISRGKLIVKVAKYPHVEDYRKTIDEIDEKQYMNLKLVVRELFNSYATIHDLLTKNLEKIKRPRTTNAENLY